MRKIYLNVSNVNNMISQFLTEPPIVLVGSAVSGWEPTSLPTGNNFTKGMFDLLFPIKFLKNDQNLINRLDILWEKIPFEHLLEKCPNHQKLTPIIKDTFTIDRVNPVHEVIAEALVNSIFKSVITTNYDLCLDKLLAKADNIKRVVTEDDVQSLHGITQKIYFKIHGSADDKKGETLVWALNHESHLPGWKHKLLSDMIKMKSLLIVGYSGLDFEICPEISKMPVKNILWNITEDADRRNQISPNARRLLVEKSGYLLVGDMRLLLSLLIRPVRATWGKSSDDLLNRIETEFTKREVAIWRASLLNSMGCASIALRASQETVAKYSKHRTDRVSLIREEAQALFHMGKYYQSARKFYKAAQEVNSDRFLHIALLLDSCDAFRCYGSFIKAVLRLKEVRKAIPDITDTQKCGQRGGKAALKEILIWKHLYQITKAVRVRSLTSVIQKKTIPLFQLASKRSLEAGNWFDFIQTRLWAERMDIDPSLLAYQIPYEPPSPREGYEHLGYHVPRSMYFRDKLNKAKNQLSPKEESVLEEHVKNCKTFGNYPELWKLYYLAIRLSKTKRNSEHISMFLKSFFFCEYTVLMRLYQLTLGAR